MLPRKAPVKSVKTGTDDLKTPRFLSQSVFLRGKRFHHLLPSIFVEMRFLVFFTRENHGLDNKKWISDTNKNTHLSSIFFCRNAGRQKPRKNQKNQVPEAKFPEMGNFMKIAS